MTIKKSNARRRVEKKYHKGENFPRVFDDDDYIESLDCTARQAYNYLRKSWLKFRICKSKDDEVGMDEAMEQINNAQRALMLPMTDWENYEG